mmetsp:Transcript_5474/g.17304  ORF Transcript_5474/g.17304 Transcript_5474/m.17304 type:complete len:215 (-) Transcript_5474:1365-2009(-)
MVGRAETSVRPPRRSRVFHSQIVKTRPRGEIVRRLRGGFGYVLYRLRVVRRRRFRRSIEKHREHVRTRSESNRRANFRRVSVLPRRYEARHPLRLETWEHLIRQLRSRENNRFWFIQSHGKQREYRVEQRFHFRGTHQPRRWDVLVLTSGVLRNRPGTSENLQQSRRLVRRCYFLPNGIRQTSFWSRANAGTNFASRNDSRREESRVPAETGVE